MHYFRGHYTNDNGRINRCFNSVTMLENYCAKPSDKLFTLLEVSIRYYQRTLTIVESITVRLTSCLTGLDLTKQVKLLFIQHKEIS